ncbi:MAG: AAA family ATPase [Bryobacterales bacterium]|nr:AAA family ATPase [Bryobacterales bacterium]
MESSDRDSGDARNYRIQVSDFGPIEHANVEFRPLTVFVGPSNTGKSYFATLSYAVHRHFAASRDPSWYVFKRYTGTAVRKPAWTPEPEALSELESWMSAVIEDRDPPRRSERVLEMVRMGIENADRMADLLQEEIVRSFGSGGTRELIRQLGTGRAKIVLSPDGFRNRGSLSYSVRMSGDELEMEGEVLGSPDPSSRSASAVGSWLWLQPSRLEVWLHSASDESGGAGSPGRRTAIARQLLEWLVESQRQDLVAPLARMAYYLPADRTGIMHIHKMVVSAIVQSAASAGLRRTPDVPKLSGVLTDFLDVLIRMGDWIGAEPARGIRSGVASQLERDILGGTVRVDASETNYPQFFYRPDGWSSDLVLMRSSSMVSELAPLVLYLRHVVRTGDVLIVEEPESHLHPAMQVQVINLLARVVREGVRIIVTTHSEWILTGLANIVQASRIDGGNGPDGVVAPALPEQQVGAWRFFPDGATKGVVVEEVKMDGDGMYPSEFDEVAVDLHNRWAEIESRAGESE